MSKTSVTPAGQPEGGAAGRRKSPLSEGAQVPHSDWGLAEGTNGVGVAPSGSDQHELAGDRRAGDAGGRPREAREQRQDSGKPAQTSPHSREDAPATTHGSGTGADAKPYETGAASGDYEGDGFNRGYGVEPDPLTERSDGYLDARHGEFGDVEDKEDLYGEGRGGTPEK